jgi:hypothetical protein
MNMDGARRLVVPLGVLTFLSASADFYVRNFHWGIENDDRIRLFFVDYSKVSKPAACTCTRPNTCYRKHSLFTPRNGAVVRARRVPDHPDWIQLPPGDYIEARICGMDVATEIDPATLPRPVRRNVQYFRELLPKRAAAAAVLSGASKDEAAALAATTGPVTPPVAAAPATRLSSLATR